MLDAAYPKPADDPNLAALYVHGSLMAGDSAPERRDEDLLAVLALEPDEDLLRRLGQVHAEVDRTLPRRRGRWRSSTSHCARCRSTS